MNRKALRIISLVFGALSLALLIFCLLEAVTLPRTITVKTFRGTVRQTYGGSFNFSYFVPCILLFAFSFWGIGLFCCIADDEEKCKSEKVETCPEEKKSDTEKIALEEKREEKAVSDE